MSRMAQQAEFVAAAAEMLVEELRADQAGTKRKLAMLDEAVWVHPETKKRRIAEGWELLLEFLGADRSEAEPVLRKFAAACGLEVRVRSEYEDQRGNGIWYKTVFELEWQPDETTRHLVVSVYGDSQCQEGQLELRGADETFGFWCGNDEERRKLGAWLDRVALSGESAELVRLVATVLTDTTPHKLEAFRERFWFCLAPAFDVERAVAAAEPDDEEFHEITVDGETVVVDVERAVAEPDSESECESGVEFCEPFTCEDIDLIPGAGQPVVVE